MFQANLARDEERVGEVRMYSNSLPAVTQRTAANLQAGNWFKWHGNPSLLVVTPI